MKNKQILLASRPQNVVQESHFRLVETDIPKAGEREFVVRAHYLSLDPYMRGRMDNEKSYAAKAEVGAVMVVGGNIDGVTRVMTTSIALETSKGDLPLALALGVVLLGVVGLLNLFVGLLHGGTATEREALA